MKLCKSVIIALAITFVLSKVFWWALGAVWLAYFALYYLVRFIIRIVVGAIIFAIVLALLLKKDRRP